MTHFPTLATNLAPGTDQGSRPLCGRVGCFQHERNEVIQVGRKAVIHIPDKVMPIRGLPEGRTKLRFVVGKVGEAHTANGNTITRSLLMDEGDHWVAMPQKQVVSLPRQSTTVEMSTMVDKQAEATAAAVVLGEDKRSWTWFGCSYCGSAYDQSEANARLRVCCGALLTVHRGNGKQ